MNKAFERYMRQRYGNRYDLTRDVEGFYCREIVKRMFEVWCHCKDGRSDAVNSSIQHG